MDLLQPCGGCPNIIRQLLQAVGLAMTGSRWIGRRRDEPRYQLQHHERERKKGADLEHTKAAMMKYAYIHVYTYLNITRFIDLFTYQILVVKNCQVSSSKFGWIKCNNQRQKPIADDTQAWIIQRFPRFCGNWFPLRTPKPMQPSHAMWSQLWSCNRLRWQDNHQLWFHTQIAVASVWHRFKTIRQSWHVICQCPPMSTLAAPSNRGQKSQHLCLAHQNMDPGRSSRSCCHWLVGLLVLRSSPAEDISQYYIAAINHHLTLTIIVVCSHTVWYYPPSMILYTIIATDSHWLKYNH